MIKLSDYVIEFLEKNGVKHAFMLPGGGSMHLVDSIGNSNIEYVCCQHEQAVAIAAESYGQHTNDIGLVLVTSGPGSTNTITGITAAWIDSTPVFVISGQAKTTDLIGNSGVRQMGSQEVEISKIVEPITKYAVTILNADEIRYHLEKAYYLSKEGRMGPVWIDIPLDIQAKMIEPDKLTGFHIEEKVLDMKKVSDGVNKITKLIQESKMPVILAGNGIKLSNTQELFMDIINKLKIPVLTTWKIIDLFDEEDELYAGHPGVMGDRGANYILQKADLLIVLGSRLDSSITAFNQVNFGKNAKKVMVDIDIHEINKMEMEIEVKLDVDIYTFLSKFEDYINEMKFDNRSEWIAYCKDIRKQYPTVTQEHIDVGEYVSAYYFIDELCKLLTSEDIIVPESSGGAGEITYQAFKIKKGQKMKNAAGLGSMGFGLPYAIGACIANNNKRTILINGDGAFQLNIQELETLKRLQLPIKIFIWNNGGYASIRAMQRNIFNGHYVASEESSGLSMPSISKIANAYGIKSFVACNNKEMSDLLPQVLSECGPVLCELMTSPFEVVSPKAATIKLPDGTMVSKPLEDMWPEIKPKEV